ncbi:hypothetical protein SprV_0702311300 [Sparganum proliferum]
MSVVRVRKSCNCRHYTLTKMSTEIDILCIDPSQIFSLCTGWGKSSPVWRKFKAVLHFELVPNGRAANSNLYCQQMG